MEEKDRHLEPEEEQDVEAHVNKNRNIAAPDEAKTLGRNVNRNVAKDDDDVEAHVNKA